MNKYLDLEMADLRHVCVECACGAKFVLDLSRPNLRAPTACSSCGTMFDKQSMQEPLWALRTAYQVLAASPNKVTFQVPIADSK